MYINDLKSPSDVNEKDLLASFSIKSDQHFVRMNQPGFSEKWDANGTREFSVSDVKHMIDYEIKEVGQKKGV